MEDPAAWGAAIAAVIMALATAFVQIMAARISKKLDQQAAATAEVHTLVNSNLTAIKEQLARALAENVTLKEEAAKKDPNQ